MATNKEYITFPTSNGNVAKIDNRATIFEPRGPESKDINSGFHHIVVSGLRSSKDFFPGPSGVITTAS